MSTKKRKPLGSAMEEFVFGTAEKEAAPPPTPEAVSPAQQAPQEAEIPPTPITPFPLLPTAKPPQPFAPTPEPVSIPSKEPSLMSKLQAPDKEATVRFTVDMSESLHRKLSVLAAKTGRKKVDIVRMLLEDGLKEVDG
jgi:hypothetical protein